MKPTEKQINDILDLHKKGKSYRLIADLTGIHPSTVYRIITPKRKKSSMTPKNDIGFIRDAWKKPLHECQPREIFDYLRSLGYKGELECLMRVKI